MIPPPRGSTTPRIVIRSTRIEGRHEHHSHRIHLPKDHHNHELDRYNRISPTASPCSSSIPSSEKSTPKEGMDVRTGDSLNRATRLLLNWIFLNHQPQQVHLVRWHVDGRVSSFHIHWTHKQVMDVVNLDPIHVHYLLD